MKKKNENKNILISVIMSEYNTDEHLLRESIESILKQTYKNIELVLIDDCGKNDVSKIAKEFNDDRIKVYRNEKNSGLVYSLNKSLELAKGEYVARMDTDDYSYNDRIEKQVKFILEHPEYTVVGTNADFYDGENITGRSYRHGEVDRKQVLNGNVLIHPSIMARKEAFLAVGGYPDYKRCEDYAMWIKLFVNGYKMYNMDDVLLRYHVSKDDYNKRTLKTRKGFFQLLKGDYKNLNPSKKQLLKMYTKTFIAGVIPPKVMYFIKKKRGVKYEKKTD